MHKVLTIISVEPETNKAGFAIRVGQEVSGHRTLNCYEMNSGTIATKPGDEYTNWFMDEFPAACKVAFQLRKSKYPDYQIDIDCLVIG
jgi:hypothetical protein